MLDAETIEHSVNGGRRCVGAFAPSHARKKVVTQIDERPEVFVGEVDGAEPADLRGGMRRRGYARRGLFARRGVWAICSA